MSRRRECLHYELQRQRRAEARSTVGATLAVPGTSAHLAILALLLACLSGCARRDPQAAFDHAMQTFRHGDIAAAASEAEKGYKQFHTLSTEWAWKFRILQAGSLLWQGRTDRTLSLLSSEPQPPKSGDLAVQRLRLEGAAYTASNQLSLAQAEDAGSGTIVCDLR